MSRASGIMLTVHLISKLQSCVDVCIQRCDSSMMASYQFSELSPQCPKAKGTPGQLARRNASGALERKRQVLKLPSR